MHNPGGLNFRFGRREWPYSAYAPYENPASKHWIVSRFNLTKEDKQRLKDEEWSETQIEALIRSQYGSELEAINSHGFYVLNAEIVGDEKRRSVAFLGCLMHPPYALCAEVAQVGNVKQPNKHLTPYIVKMLKTIEFIPGGQ